MLYVTLFGVNRVSGNANRAFALPIPIGQDLPSLPEMGIRTEAEALEIPGVQVIDHVPDMDYPSVIDSVRDIAPGPDPTTYVFLRTVVQRNLYRVPLAP